METHGAGPDGAIGPGAVGRRTSNLYRANGIVHKTEELPGTLVQASIDRPKSLTARAVVLPELTGETIGSRTYCVFAETQNESLNLTWGNPARTALGVPLRAATGLS